MRNKKKMEEKEYREIHSGSNVNQDLSKRWGQTQNSNAAMT